MYIMYFLYTINFCVCMCASELNTHPPKPSCNQLPSPVHERRITISRVTGAKVTTAKKRVKRTLE